MLHFPVEMSIDRFLLEADVSLLKIKEFVLYLREEIPIDQNRKVPLVLTCLDIPAVNPENFTFESSIGVSIDVDLFSNGNQMEYSLILCPKLKYCSAKYAKTSE